MIFRVSFLVALGWALAALSHSGATGVVKERMDSMGELAQAMKALAKAPKPDEVAALARIIREKSGEKMVSQFPMGSLHGPSEASPKIWTDGAEFKVLAAELARLGGQLEAAATDRQSVERLFGELKDICSACHKTYREKR